MAYFFLTFLGTKGTDPGGPFFVPKSMSSEVNELNRFVNLQFKYGGRFISFL